MIYKKGDNMKEVFIYLLILTARFGMLIGSILTRLVELLIRYKKIKEKRPG